MNWLFGRNNQPNKLGEVQVQTSEYGTVVPVVCGSNRIAMKLIDYFNFQAQKNNYASGGKGGAPSAYEYYAAVVALLCEGPMDGIGDILDSSGADFLVQADEAFTVATSHTVINSGAAFYYDFGVFYGASYLVVINDYGSDGSQTLTGTYPVSFQKIASGSPGPGQYKVSATGVYTFNSADVGKLANVVYAYSTDTNETTDTGQQLVSPAQTLALSVFNGTRPQTAWGSDIRGGMCYAGRVYIADSQMDLGSDATIPNYTFEVLNGLGLAFGGGQADCCPADILYKILRDPIIGLNWTWTDAWTQYRNYCVANGLFMSPVYDSSSQMSSVIKDILDVTNSERFWSEKVMKIVPYGDQSAVGYGVTYSPATQPVANFDDDDFIVSDKPKSSGEQPQEPVTIEWPDLTDTFNWLTLEYQERAYNYNTSKVSRKNQASIEANGLRPEKTVSAHQYTGAGAAHFACDALLRRMSTPLRTYKFSLSEVWALLEPMDIITLTRPIQGLNGQPVRITSIEQDEDSAAIKIEAEDFIYGAGTGTLYPTQPPGGGGATGKAFPGPVSAPVLFEATARLSKSGAYELWMGLSGASPNWGGCRIWMSTDGTNYQVIGKQEGNARAGWLTNNVATGSDPDTTNTVKVELYNTLLQLLGGNASVADNLYTLCMMGSGAYELFSYETATLTAAGKYNLTTYLRRGVFGTPITSQTGNASSALGAPFCRLDNQVFAWEYDPTLIGKTVYLKFTSFNLYQKQEETLANVTAYSIPLTGFYAVNGNTLNTMTIDSIVASGGASDTIRIYGTTGGVGTSGSITKPDGTTITIPAATFTGENFDWLYYINWSPMQNGYVLYTTYSAQLAGQMNGEIIVGSVLTVASDGSGGGSGGGGGGSGPPLPPISCTTRGTRLVMANGNAVSNEEIKARFDAGEGIYLRTETGLAERLIAARWVPMTRYCKVDVEGMGSFGCSGSHAVLPAGAANYLPIRMIASGAHLKTSQGYKSHRQTWIEEAVDVLEISLIGPDHTYLVATEVTEHGEGVCAHNLHKM